MNQGVIKAIFVAVFWINFSDGQECTTPVKTKGKCTLITLCKPLFQILKERPITSDGADLLKSSQCGVQNDTPKVCCPVASDGISDRKVVKKEDADAGPITSDLLPKQDICGRDSPDDKVIGGNETGLLEFPWMALIGYQKENSDGSDLEFNCGASLINSRYVVTAAHCINGSKIQEEGWKIVSVRLGEHNKKTNPDCTFDLCADDSYDVPVEEKILHKDYRAFDRNYHHDIALLRLAREVKITDFVRPICLPTSEKLLQTSYSGKNLTVAGWGQTEHSLESDVKLKLQIPVRPDDYCRSQYAQARIWLKSGQMCAGGQKKKDSCNGDSGGPLMSIEPVGRNINWYLIGVVSIGPDQCGTSLWPGVYTKVADYVRWIVQNIKP